jgi:Glycosyl hydrolase family 20, catalytic domain
MLMVLMMVIVTVQLGFVHFRYPIEDEKNHNNPLSVVREEFTERRSTVSKSLKVVAQTAASKNMERENGWNVSTNPTGSRNTSQLVNTQQKTASPTKAPAVPDDPPPRFDVLARQHGPEPPFPSDFDPTGSVIDILRDPTFDLSNLNPLKLTLRTNMLGILIDAGRHFFPVPWLKRLLDVMHVLQYNLLHLRLTDDQAFAIRLESQPNLTCPTHIYGNNQVYSRDDIKDLLQHARTKGIAIVPEINVPGHSGAWMGIPGLVVPCKRLACSKGYGLPLNASHPDIRGILTDVIREVIDIFENPPYLHLGGDEIELAKPCFDEVGSEFFDYNIFESMLKDILKDVGYPENQVIRWRETDFAATVFNIKTNIKREVRAGSINHWWHDTPGKTENVTVGTPIIGSARLYMDVNNMEAAWEVFLHARKWWHLGDVFAQTAPVNLKGIIVGTFELGTAFFHHRNVVGRMLAVTIGVSDVVIRDGNQVNELYAQLCRQANFPDNLCKKYGLPIVDWSQFKMEWSDMWSSFRSQICKRYS